MHCSWPHLKLLCSRSMMWQTCAQVCPQSSMMPQGLRQPPCGHSSKSFADPTSVTVPCTWHTSGILLPMAPWRSSSARMGRHTVSSVVRAVMLPTRNIPEDVTQCNLSKSRERKRGKRRTCLYCSISLKTLSRGPQLRVFSLEISLVILANPFVLVIIKETFLH